MVLEFGHGSPLFWSVPPMRDLTEGDVGWFGVRFRPWRGRGKLGWGGWGLLVDLGCIIRKGLILGFGIWVGILLFWSVSPVRALAMGGG